MDLENRQNTFQETRSQSEAAQRKPLSTELFGIDWNKYFPYKVPNTTLALKYSSYDESYDFLSENYATLDQDNQFSLPFAPDGSPNVKKRFYKVAGDFIHFEVNGKLAGIFVGNPIDWGTYYLRGVCILEDYREFKIFQNFTKYFLDILKEHGVVRALGEVSSANLINTHILNKLGFNITGTRVSENWGMMTQFTKFLNPENEAYYLDRHCFGVKPQLKNRTSTKGTDN